MNNIKFIPCDTSNFKFGRNNNITHIVIHYTGGNNDTALNNANYFSNNKKLGVSAHYFVDEKEIIKSVNEMETAWHSGKAEMNDKSIGIELCSVMDKNGKYYFKDKTIENAIKIVCHIIEKYNIPLNNIIRHYDVNGKRCPAPFVDNLSLEWFAFLEKIKNEMEEEKMTQERFNELAQKYEQEKINKKVSDWAKENWQKALDKGIFDGSMPQMPLTREQLATILFRLGLV